MAARFLIRRTRLERKFLKAYNRARYDWEQKQASFMEEEKELRSREMVLARNYPIQLASLHKCPSEVLKSNKDDDDNDNFDDERTIPVHPVELPCRWQSVKISFLVSIPIYKRRQSTCEPAGRTQTSIYLEKNVP